MIIMNHSQAVTAGIAYPTEGQVTTSNVGSFRPIYIGLARLF